MSAYVLLNLLNELEKRDKMLGLLSILSVFRNEFNKFNNIRARMLDSGLNNILFTVTLTCYDIFTHNIFLGFDGKRRAFMLVSPFRYLDVYC